MASKLMTASSLVLLAALAGAAPVSADDVKLSINDGRVILFAQEATLGQILAEWERVGGTKVFNREMLPAGRVTLSLANEPESQALAVLLRSLGGYLAVRRTTYVPGASIFDRIIILSGAVPVRAVGTPTPQTAASAQPFGRGQTQRRVLADGRVVSFVENPDRPGEISMVEDDPGDQPQPGGASRYMPDQLTPDPLNFDPLVGPGGRGIQLGPGSMPTGGYPGQSGLPRGGQTSADPFSLQPPASRPKSGPTTAPIAPGTAVSPGVLVPGQKPPGPPKGPGDEST